MSVVARAREIAALAAEVADFDWRHPAWMALAMGTAGLEALAERSPRPVASEPYAAYGSANCGPRSDTLMARTRTDGAPGAAERIARAVARARAAAAMLERIDGSLPEQSLCCALASEGGWMRRVPCAPWVAAFVTPRGVARLDLARPASAVAEALGAFCGRGIAPPAAAGAVALAVDLAPQPLASARHLHRRAWTDGGGPWLGLGETADLEIVTTCHLVVDGFGHGLIADGVFRALAAFRGRELDDLAAAATRGLAGATACFPEARPVAGAMPLGFAGRVLDASGVTFPRVAYALGRALEPMRRTGARHGPTFQIAVAPADAGDGERRRRRVVFGLLSLAAGEPYASFHPRLRTALGREIAGQGLLMRLLAATATAPLPRGAKRRLLVSRGATHPLLPPVAALAGRASLSLIRYPEAERPLAPLFALSGPPLDATADDPDGSSVITLIDHGSSMTVTVAGTGRAGNDAGAAALLDTFERELHLAR